MEDKKKEKIRMRDLVKLYCKPSQCFLVEEFFQLHLRGEVLKL